MIMSLVKDELLNQDLKEKKTWNEFAMIIAMSLVKDSWLTNDTYKLREILTATGVPRDTS